MDTRIFEALADENRLAIVGLLADGEKCVCDVAAALDISNALASHHIKRLRDTGLITTRRRGTWLHCGLDRDTVRGLVAQLGELADRAPAVGPACCSAGAIDLDVDTDPTDG